MRICHFNRWSQFIWVLALVVAGSLGAQQQQQHGTLNSSLAGSTQIGGTFGLGFFGTTEYSSDGFLVARMEACLRCAGKFGWFTEFNHWRLSPAGYETSVLNLAAAGLRIQGRARRVRPFFDVGASIGFYDGKPHGPIHKSESFAMGGVMIGTGAAISVGEKWYVRPQARLAIMGTGNIAGFFGGGVGYRF